MINDFSDEYERIEGKPVTLAPANPYRLILYAAAMAIYQGMQYTDFTGKQNLLKYSMGDYLENLVAMLNIGRKEATPASTVLKFTIENPLPSVCAIPKGTRVTNGQQVFFQTDEYAEIPIGQTSVDVAATCTVAGAIGEIKAGELNQVVNVLPYVVTVTNPEQAIGGADREEDVDLRDRAYMVPKTFSVAGPSGAYYYHTQDTTPEIGDVMVDDVTPQPGIVDVYFVMEDGSLPTEAMRERVYDNLDSRTKRPLTDQVFVKEPGIAEYSVDITYYIPTSKSSLVDTIQREVETAVSAYNVWQTEKIGRDITPDVLIQKVMEAGAKRVDVAEPAFTVVGRSVIPRNLSVNVVYGGIEDD